MSVGDVLGDGEVGLEGAEEAEAPLGEYAADAEGYQDADALKGGDGVQEWEAGEGGCGGGDCHEQEAEGYSPS